MSAGQLQPGSLRMSRTTFFSGGFPDGFLSFNPTRASIHHSGSSWTGLLGHSGMLDMGGGLDWPQTGRWLFQSGSFSTDTTSRVTVTVSFASQYSGAPPIVQLTCQSAVVPFAYTWSIKADSITSSGFNSMLSPIGSPNSTTFAWSSYGTAAF